MIGYIVLVVLVLAVIAALEFGNRRHSTGLTGHLYGSWDVEDRDLARTRLDLLALGAASEPSTTAEDDETGEAGPHARQ
ncbi:hypothetical protein [Kribbella sp. VKM Ac-2566]|uniref:hypothetical protein n=1 Tax=Kribbella sp. VKM Ac-2566 TaxID=2512218 RepID=UPI0010640DBB|nr:hypothetical protein [Kribbella sp. VKM Ac-2566]